MNYSVPAKRAQRKRIANEMLTIFECLDMGDYNVIQALNEITKLNLSDSDAEYFSERIKCAIKVNMAKMSYMLSDKCIY